MDRLWSEGCWKLSYGIRSGGNGCKNYQKKRRR
jgi:hypothetical protein